MPCVLRQMRAVRALCVSRVLQLQRREPAPPAPPATPAVPSSDEKRARAPLPAGTAGVWRKACIEGAPPPPARAAAAAEAPIPAAFVLVTLYACPPTPQTPGVGIIEPRLRTWTCRALPRPPAATHTTRRPAEAGWAAAPTAAPIPAPCSLLPATRCRRLRAYLKGWQFVFLYDVTCLNEIPAVYDAYRKQQHRWSCGPMQLWRKAAAAVAASALPAAEKLYLFTFFFGVRMLATHVVSFGLYCLLVPLCILLPEAGIFPAPGRGVGLGRVSHRTLKLCEPSARRQVSIPNWALIYCPLAVTVSTVAFTPSGWYHLIAFVVYENAMCVVRASAVVSGLLELSDAHEWVVTSKLGTWAASKARRRRGPLGGVAAAGPAAAQLPGLQGRERGGGPARKTGGRTGARGCAPDALTAQVSRAKAGIARAVAKVGQAVPAALRPASRKVYKREIGALPTASRDVRADRFDATCRTIRPSLSSSVIPPAARCLLLVGGACIRYLTPPASRDSHGCAVPGLCGLRVLPPEVEIRRLPADPGAERALSRTMPVGVPGASVTPTSPAGRHLSAVRPVPLHR